MKSEVLRAVVRDGRTAMEYQIQPGEMMDGIVLKQCKEGAFDGVLPMGASYENGHNYMYAYTDQKTTLAEKLSDVVTAKTILLAFEGIVSTLHELQKENVNLSYMVLDTKHIYIEEATQQVKLICMPGKSATMSEQEIPEFFRTILANAVYLNSENGDYVAKLLSALNKDFELGSFLRTIHGEMMDLRIEKPEVVAPVEVVEPETAEPMVAELVETVTPVEAEPVETVAPVEVEPIVAESVAPEAVTPVEAEVVTPVAPEVVAPVEAVAVEPIVAEPVETVAPFEVEPAAVTPVETVALESVETVAPVKVEPIAAESVESETVAPVEAVAVEPIAAESVEPEAVTPVEAVVATPEVVTPVEPETIAPEVVAPVAPVAPAAVVSGVIPQDEIEFEPIPDELNAKIKKMNEHTPTAEAVQPQPAEVPQPEPTVAVQPQQAVTPQPTVAVQPQQAATPQPQPTVVPQPQQAVAPQPTMPQPQLMPQDASLHGGQLIPHPHLIRMKTGENLVLPEGEFVIGKSATNVNYTIADNPAVSRVHCTIIKKNGVYYVRDENSTNATYVNGERVLPGTEHLLLNNCKLLLGDEEFIYSLW